MKASAAYLIAMVISFHGNQIKTIIFFISSHIELIFGT